MNASQVIAAPTDGLWRVGHGVDPFVFSPPRHPLPDKAGPVLDGNRWDDPEAIFSTLYLASTAEGAFAETIARYRPTLGLLDRIDAFLTGEPDAEYDFPLDPGRVPDDYFSNRTLGHAWVTPAARFVDVDHPQTHTAAQAPLEPLLRAYGLTTVDRSVMFNADRRITRRIARHYWQLAQSADHDDWAGLRYESRLGPGWECWALWEASVLTPEATTGIVRLNPALQAAARALGVQV